MKRITGLLLATVLLAAGIGATTAGVIPLEETDTVSVGSEDDRQVDALESVDDVIALPGTGPNGDYVVIDEYDRLAIDLTGENPNVAGDGVPPAALTGIDDVLVLEYTGSESTAFWIETDDERLDFHTESGSITDEKNAIVLTPDERVSVGFSVEGDDLSAGDQLTASFAVRTTPPTDALYVPYPDATIEVLAPDNTTREVTIEYARSHIELTGDAERFRIGPNASLEEFTVRFDDRGHPSFTIDAETARRDGLVERLPSGAVGIGAYAVEDVDEGKAIRDLEYRFAVDRSWFAKSGVDPTQITVYSDDGERENWTVTETTVVDETPETIFVEARVDTSSRHVLAVETAVLDVTELSVKPATVTPGEEFTVRATIENLGLASGTDEMAVMVDGDPIGTMTASADADEAVTETFEHTIDEPGEYELRVGNADPVTLVVGNADDTAHTDSSSATSAEDSGTENAGEAETNHDIDGSGELIDEAGAFGPIRVTAVFVAISTSLGTIWLIRRSRY
ncbi:CARDB domain-containing protein [Natrialbaceae archaeon A-chndr2]